MDFQCPYCKRFHSQTFPNLKNLYIDKGKVRFYVVDLPLDIHPQAMLAAQAGQCAADQGKFWSVHDLMEEEAAPLERSKISELAAKADIEMSAFNKCLADARHEASIKSGVAAFFKLGIHATPTFIIGKSTPTGVEGELLVGAMPLGAFQQKIESIVGSTP